MSTSQSDFALFDSFLRSERVRKEEKGRREEKRRKEERREERGEKIKEANNFADASIRRVRRFFCENQQS